MTPRFHLPDPAAPLWSAEQRLPLPAAVQHHAHRVLRLQAGSPITVFDGSGHQAHGVLLDDRAREVRLTSIAPPEPGPAVQLVLAQGISSGERMDWTIEKAVEIGVTRIVPLQGLRSAVRLNAPRAEQRRERWQRIIVAACAQSGRSRLPELDPVAPLTSWLTTPAGLAVPGSSLLLDPEGTRTLAEALDQGGPAPSSPTGVRTIQLLCGPESGWAPEERHAALQAGYLAVRLGRWVLRTETAGPATLAALQALVGDWQSALPH